MVDDLELLYKKIDAYTSNSAVGGGNAFDVAKAQVNVLVAETKLSEKHKVLDFGCGIGRTMPLLYSRLGGNIIFDGCDISNDFVKQCRELYQNYPFRFFKIYSENSHYANFDLSKIDDGIPENFYEFAYSFSVFTHLTLKLASDTLLRVADALEQGGAYYFTLFRIDEMSAAIINSGRQDLPFKFSVSVNDGDAEYFAIPSDPLAFAALGRKEIEDAAVDAGFSIERFIPGAWRGLSANNIHDAYLISKA